MVTGRQFGRETSIYLAGFVGAGAIQFLAIPVYSRALGPDQYGYLTLTIAATTVLSGVMAVGGDVTLARFWADAPTMDRQRALASTWIPFLTIWSIAVAFVGCLLTPWVSRELGADVGLGAVLVLGILGLIPAQLSRMLAQILRNTYRPFPFAITTTLITAANVALGVTFALGWNMGLQGIVLGILVGESAGSVVRFLLVRPYLGAHGEWASLAPLLRFGIPFVPASIANWVFVGMDRVAVSRYLPIDSLGSYGLAATLVGPFTILTLAVGQVWVPRISQLHAQAPQAASRLTERGLRASLLLYGLAAMTVGTLAPWIIPAVGGAAFQEGASVLPLLVTGAAFGGVSLFAATGLTLSKRTRGVPVVTVAAALINVLLLIVLVPRVGLIGAAVAVSVAYLSLAAGNLYASSRVYPLNLGIWWLGTGAATIFGQAIVATAYPSTPWSFGAWLVASALFSYRLVKLRGAPGSEARPSS